MPPVVTRGDDPDGYDDRGASSQEYVPDDIKNESDSDDKPLKKKAKTARKHTRKVSTGKASTTKHNKGKARASPSRTLGKLPPFGAENINQSIENMLMQQFPNNRQRGATRSSTVNHGPRSARSDSTYTIDNDPDYEQDEGDQVVPEGEYNDVDGWVDVEDIEENSLKPPKRAPRAPRPKLINWNENAWKLAILGLVWACGTNEIYLPFGQAAQLVAPHCTGAALQQAILKLRDSMSKDGHQIPRIYMNWTRRKPLQDPNKPRRSTLPKGKPTLMQASQTLLITLPRAYKAEERQHLPYPLKFDSIGSSQCAGQNPWAIVNYTPRVSPEGPKNAQLPLINTINSRSGFGNNNNGNQIMGGVNNYQGNNRLMGWANGNNSNQSTGINNCQGNNQLMGWTNRNSGNQFTGMNTGYNDNQLVGMGIGNDGTQFNDMDNFNNANQFTGMNDLNNADPMLGVTFNTLMNFDMSNLNADCGPTSGSALNPQAASPDNDDTVANDLHLFSNGQGHNSDAYGDDNIIGLGKGYSGGLTGQAQSEQSSVAQTNGFNGKGSFGFANRGKFNTGMSTNNAFGFTADDRSDFDDMTLFSQGTLRNRQGMSLLNNMNGMMCNTFGGFGSPEVKPGSFMGNPLPSPDPSPFHGRPGFASSAPMSGGNHNAFVAMADVEGSTASGTASNGFSASTASMSGATSSSGSGHTANTSNGQQTSSTRTQQSQGTMATTNPFQGHEEPSTPTGPRRAPRFTTPVNRRNAGPSADDSDEKPYTAGGGMTRASADEHDDDLAPLFDQDFPLNDFVIGHENDQNPFFSASGSGDSSMNLLGKRSRE